MSRVLWGITSNNIELSSGLNFFIPIKDALKQLDLIVRHPNDTRPDSDTEDDDPWLSSKTQ